MNTWRNFYRLRRHMTRWPRSQFLKRWMRLSGWICTTKNTRWFSPPMISSSSSIKWASRRRKSSNPAKGSWRSRTSSWFLDQRSSTRARKEFWSGPLTTATSSTFTPSLSTKMGKTFSQLMILDWTFGILQTTRQSLMPWISSRMKSKRWLHMRSSSPIIKIYACIRLPKDTYTFVISGINRPFKKELQ